MNHHPHIRYIEGNNSANSANKNNLPQPQPQSQMNITYNKNNVIHHHRQNTAIAYSTTKYNNEVNDFFNDISGSEDISSRGNINNRHRQNTPSSPTKNYQTQLRRHKSIDLGSFIMKKQHERQSHNDQGEIQMYQRHLPQRQLLSNNKTQEFSCIQQQSQHRPEQSSSSQLSTIYGSNTLKQKQKGYKVKIPTPSPSASPSASIPVPPPATKCSNCVALQYQNKKIIQLMKQQIQIAVSKYNEQAGVLIKQQTKQIVHLQNVLANNAKLIKSACSPDTLQYSTVSYSTKNHLNSNGVNLSSSKISTNSQLNKSQNHNNCLKSNRNTSKSPHQRQKIGVVSKELSPLKPVTSVMGCGGGNVHMNQSHNNQLKNQNRGGFLSSGAVSTHSIRLGNTASNNKQSQNVPQMEYHQIMEKISCLERNILQFTSHEQAITEKLHALEKDCLNLYGSRLSTCKKDTALFMTNYDERIQALYKQMKIISGRIGSGAGLGLGSNSNKALSISNVSTSQKLTTQNAARSASNLAATSNLSLAGGQRVSATNGNNLSQQQFTRKMTKKIKNAFSQLQQLKDSLGSLSSKQFKYDNYQLEDLATAIRSLQKSIYQLQRGRHQMSQQIQQNQIKLLEVIEMSKYSQQQRLQNGIKNKQQYPRSQQNKSSVISVTPIANQKMVNRERQQYLHPAPTTTLAPQSQLRRPNSHDQQDNSTFLNDFSHSVVSRTKSTKPKTINMVISAKQQRPRSKLKMTGYTKNDSNDPSPNSRHYSAFQAQQSTISNNDLNDYNNLLYNRYNQSENNSFEDHNSSSQGQKSFEHEPEDDEFFYPASQQMNSSTKNKNKSSFQGASLQNRQPQQSHLNKQSKSQYYHNDYQNHQSCSISNVVCSTQSFKQPNNHNSHNKLIGSSASNYRQFSAKNSSNIRRFMDVIENSEDTPLSIQIDQTGYIKSANNGMYIVDSNMDGFQLSQQELHWLKTNGYVQI